MSHVACPGALQAANETDPLVVKDGGKPPLSTEGDFRLAPDGYLYILAFGQSNMAGTTEGTDDWMPLTGDASRGDIHDAPATCHVADLSGKWVQMKYHHKQRTSLFYGDNNLAFVFCRELAEKYPEAIGKGIRLVFVAQGGASIENFYNGGKKWEKMKNYYDAYTMGVDIYPASVVLMHQGESNQGNYAPEYVPKWDNVFAGFMEQGWIEDVNNTRAIVGEIGRESRVNRALHIIGTANPNRRISGIDGCDKSRESHNLGTGYERLGKKYLKIYLDMVYNRDPGDRVRPRHVKAVPTVTNITEHGCTINWLHPDETFPYKDIYRDEYQEEEDIVGFVIYGWGGYKEIARVGPDARSYNATFSLPSGKKEVFRVNAVDAAGNESFWKTRWGVAVEVP
ncbi:MAG: hypothetical protein LC725_00585 [Lentisphaerae bacterium]|nr:hypothetical protein [Lentisphaerota bacterium]